MKLQGVTALLGIVIPQVAIVDQQVKLQGVTALLRIVILQVAIVVQALSLQLVVLMVHDHKMLVMSVP